MKRTRRDTYLDRYIEENSVDLNGLDPGPRDFFKNYFRRFPEFRKFPTLDRKAQFHLACTYPDKPCNPIDGDSIFFLRFIKAYCSFEDYNPRCVCLIYKKILKKLYTESKHRRRTKPPTRSKRITEEYNDAIEWLNNEMVHYFRVNEDYLRLESFLVKSRTNVEKHIIFEMMLSLKRNPHPKVLSLYFLGSIETEIPTRIKLSDTGLVFDVFMKEYFKRQKHKTAELNVLETFDKIFKNLSRQDPDWFYNRYLEEEPQGALWQERYRKDEFVWQAWGLPDSHPYSKAYPTNSIHPPGAVGMERYNYITKSQMHREGVHGVQNYFRSALGIPNVGEGWIGEAELLRKVRNWYPQLRIIHQWQPKWLGRQRIDIGIPSLKIAVEYHGTQHFQPVEYFGGKKAYKQQVARDQEKAKKCKDNGVRLIIFTERDSDSVIKRALSSYIK